MIADEGCAERGCPMHDSMWTKGVPMVEKKDLGELIEVVQKIQIGCQSVLELKDAHKDTHTLAELVLRDCNIALAKWEKNK